MAMTPIEMIDFFGASFERTRKGLEVGISTDNYQLIVLNYRQGFKCKLMQGLITWRIEAGSPKVYITDAVKVANEAVTYLTKFFNNNKVAADFPVEIASVLSYLLGEPFNMPKCDTKDISFDRLLTFELSKILQGQKNESDWDNIIINHKANKRTNLIMNTYDVYRNLLFTRDLDDVDTLVQKGEILFEKRSDDAFYIGGEGVEGGGPDNDVTVDYRLAAILKYISYDGKSIHKWRWE